MIVFLTADFMTESTAMLNQDEGILAPSIRARYSNMKLNALEKIYTALMDEECMVGVSEDIASKASKALGGEVRIN
jgi:quinolinate synthase